jgi:flagellar hook protein FlgE
LQAESEGIDTTGNNLANLNTTGFKGSTVDFQDMVSEAMGATASTDVGLGVTTPLNILQFTQGPVQTTSSATDCAIEGNVFLRRSGRQWTTNCSRAMAHSPSAATARCKRRPAKTCRDGLRQGAS